MQLKWQTCLYSLSQYTGWWIRILVGLISFRNGVFSTSLDIKVTSFLSHDVRMQKWSANKQKSFQLLYVKANKKEPSGGVTEITGVYFQ